MLLEEYRESAGKIPVPKRLRRHFQFIRDHADLLILLYRNGMMGNVSRKFSVLIPEIVPDFSEDPVEQEYLLQYAASGIEGIEQVWIRRGFQESTEDIVRLAEKLLQGEYFKTV